MVQPMELNTLTFALIIAAAVILVLSILTFIILSGNRRLRQKYESDRHFFGEVSGTVTGTLELEEILKKTIGLLADRIGRKNILLYTIEQNYDSSSNEIRKHLKCIAIPGAISLSGFKPFSIEITGELSSLLKSISEKKPAAVTMPGRISERLKQSKFTAVPILIKEVPVGLILADHDIPEEAVPPVMYFANHAGLAMETDRLAQKVKELSPYDELTKIYSYTYFQKKMPEILQLARRYRNYLSLAIIEIDNFRQFTDINGITAGDFCLYKLAQVLNSTVRSGDMLFMYGNARFCVVLPATDKKGALVACEKIKNSVENSSFEYSKDYSNTNFTASIGISTYPNDAHNPEDLAECSEKALGKAKLPGKDKVCLYRSK